MDFEHFMHLSLEQAKLAGDEVPVGAVLVDADGNVLAAAHNYREQKNDPTSHAEVEVIRGAANALGSWRLERISSAALGSTAILIVAGVAGRHECC